MSQNSAFYTKIFINRFDPEKETSLLKFLPEEDKELAELVVTPNEIDSAFLAPSALLNQIHYSWLAESLSDLPLDTKLLYLSSLPESMAQKITLLLNLTDPVIPLKGVFNTFIQKKFAESLLPEDFIPLGYIPSSDLTPLTHLSKKELLILIDFLGLFDLANTMKSIIDTRLLKKITKILSTKEKAVVKHYLKKKEKIQPPPFPLNDWSGDPKELKKRLHKIGLNRLAKAVSGQDPHFLWHLMHKLDTGRAKSLEPMISDKEVPHITASMKTKVLQLILFAQKDQGA